MKGKFFFSLGNGDIIFVRHSLESQMRDSVHANSLPGGKRESVVSYGKGDRLRTK